MRLVPALSAAILAATAVTAVPAAAAPPTLPEQARGDDPPGKSDDFSLSTGRPHCSTHVLSPVQIRAGQHSKIRCFPTQAEARLDVGLPDALDEIVDVDNSTLDATLEGETSRGANGIEVWAVHYDGHGYGTSLTITGGSTCDGSGLSFSAGEAWNDRISSTRPLYCGQVKHWQHWNRTGVQQNTVGTGMIFGLNGSLNNQVSSISYTP